MKKSLLLAPIVTLAMISFTNTAINVKAAKVYKQTATVYQMKKTGKTYKITSQTKKTADRDLNISKIINVKGKSYYYSHVFKGYVTQKAFALNGKLDAKRSKDDMNSSNTGKKTDNNSSNNNSNQENSNNANVQNGYNNDTDTVVNYGEYQRVYLQTMLSEINKYRISNGLQPLELDTTLTQIAQTRAQQNYNLRDTPGFDGHHDQNGTELLTQLTSQYGINPSYLGENGSNGHFISGMDAIMENPIDAAKGEIGANYLEGPTGGHYQNMMNPNFTKVGLGVYVGPNNGQQTKGGTDEVYSN